MGGWGVAEIQTMPSRQVEDRQSRDKAAGKIMVVREEGSFYRRPLSQLGWRLLRIPECSVLISVHKNSMICNQH